MTSLEPVHPRDTLKHIFREPAVPVRVRMTLRVSPLKRGRSFARFLPAAFVLAALSACGDSGSELQDPPRAVAPFVPSLTRTVSS
jgi:hypothetical protein